MTFATTYVRILGAFSVFFGLVYLFAPALMTLQAGFGELPAAGLTDVRATYGGFQIGVGVFLFWAAQDASRVRGALLLMALSIGAIGLSRAIGLTVDGGLNLFHTAGLITEVSLTALTLFVLSRAQAPSATA